MGSPEKCGSASASVRQALAEAASSGSTTLTTCCASAACANHRVPGGAPLINCKHSRFSTLLYFLADKRICQARRRGQCAPLAAPELGSCGSSGRAWWLWAVRCSQEKRVAHWAIELAAWQSASRLAGRVARLAPTCAGVYPASVVRAL
eukprot:scaffold52683_cov69-Phaeocystis_antarctica.AAC.1